MSLPKKAASRRGVVDRTKLEEMLAVLIRNREAFNATRELLKPQHIQNIGMGHALLWRVVLAFVDSYNRLPYEEQLYAEIEQALTDGFSLEDSEIEALNAFIEWAFDDSNFSKKINKSRHYSAVALETCRKFIEDCTAYKASEIFSGGYVPVDLPSVLQNIQSEIEVARTLTSTIHAPLFCEGWDETLPVVTVSTGIGILDSFFGGGFSPDAVYTFIGPMGSCKTTLSVQLAVHFTQLAALQFIQKPKEKKPITIFVSSEMTEPEARRRIISCGAKIPRSTLRKMKSMKDLSRAKTPAATKETEYERNLFPGGEGFMNEYSRCLMLTRMMNSHFVFINCTGANVHNPNAGVGGMSEVQAEIDAICRRDNVVPNLVILDHAFGLMERVISKMPSPDARIQEAILRQVPFVAGQIAKKYRCPFFIAHQLKGSKTGNHPLAALHHSDATGATSFSMYADFAVVSGRLTEDKQQLGCWSCTKHRDQPPIARAIIGIDPLFAMIVDKSKTHAIDPVRRTIVAKADLDLFSRQMSTKSNNEIFDELET